MRRWRSRSRSRAGLFRGRCDAAVYDSPNAAVLENGSRLAGPLNAAIRALLADATVDRLERRWLDVDLQRLPVLPG